MFSSISAMVAMNAFYVPESPPDSSQPDPSESGMRLSGREVLGHNGSYILEWSYDYKAQVITFNITAKTTGWVGFGLSRDGSMKEADIVIAVVQANGPPYIIVSHVLSNLCNSSVLNRIFMLAIFLCRICLLITRENL